MANLVIVESPAKAKTIQKYLGKDYEVIASMGHVRDLPKSRLGVDIENDFTPEYIDIKGKGDVLKALKNGAKKKERVYLATDPDREGEAISWHLSNLLGLDVEQANRVTFNEITKSGIRHGMENPRAIDINLVNAQQARRILDRIVGYKLSPFLWKKVKKGLSAGRVQSVVVKLIVDREREINAFTQEEYWTIDAKMSASGSRKQFPAKLHSRVGEKEKTVISNKEQADAILKDLEGKDYVVTSVKRGVRKKSPTPPFTTSTLQQEASRKLGFQARRTMKAAQELYEGVEVEELGAVGLISYMRTDSLRVSDEAVKAASDFISARYGKEYLPDEPRVFKSKSNAQDGHEAIRPTMPDLVPEKVKGSLTSDQYKLYKLIWDRFIASQMANALLDTVNAEITAGDYIFKASGFTVKFDGYTVVYEESKENGEEKQAALPAFDENDVLKLAAIEGVQHFTQPPARYTEASLIKTLEENGIGRPSTYVPTLTTVLSRDYVERDGKALKPTALGEITNQLMEEQFKDIVNVEFTANMENNLDMIEEGKENWKHTLNGFYKDFADNLEQAAVNMEGVRLKVPDEETDVVCDLCGRNMVIKSGRFGKFLACPGFPECKNTKKLVQDTGGICPKCGGKVIAKKSKKGRGFYGCETYPNCDFTTWDKPQAEKCPKCGSTLFRKMGRGALIHCLKEGCDYTQAVKKKDDDEA
ncbi:MAG: type I DNA topoisomerase [Oscillospiraceae bacterium]|nr:type I DNA topoisomerase [Oscillospiraceae bacterium]